MYFLQNKVLENFRLYKNHQRCKEVKTYLDYSYAFSITQNICGISTKRKGHLFLRPF